MHKHMESLAPESPKKTRQKTRYFNTCYYLDYIPNIHVSAPRTLRLRLKVLRSSTGLLSRNLIHHFLLAIYILQSYLINTKLKRSASKIQLLIKIDILGYYLRRTPINLTRYINVLWRVIRACKARYRG